MAIEPVEPTHYFYKVSVEGFPSLERVMTNSSGFLIIPEAVKFAHNPNYDVTLQTPRDAWIARLAQHPDPTDKTAFDYQHTRGLVLVWFDNNNPLITIYTGIPHNLILTRAQEGYDSFAKHDWQVPLEDCAAILSLQHNRIRPYPGEEVHISTTNAELDQLTLDLYGDITPLIAKYHSDRHFTTMPAYYPSTNDIKPNHVRVRSIGLGVDDDVPGGTYARGRFDDAGRARARLFPALTQSTAMAPSEGTPSCTEHSK